MCDNFVPLAFRKYCKYGTYPYPIPNPPPHEIPKRCYSSSSSSSSCCSSESSKCYQSSSKCCSTSPKCCKKECCSTSPKCCKKECCSTSPKCCKKKCHNTSIVSCSQKTYEVKEFCESSNLCNSLNINHFKCPINGSSEKPFIITLVNKRGHPWESKITDTPNCFAIDGVKGKSLYLKKNMEYFFVYQVPNNIKISDQFYFTQDPIGGPKDILYISSKLYNTTNFDKICLRITENFPNILYYQSKNHRFMGGVIFIVTKY